MQNQSYLPNEIKIIKRVLFQQYSLDVTTVLFHPKEIYLDFLNGELTDRKIVLNTQLFACPKKNSRSKSINFLNEMLKPIYLTDPTKIFESEGLIIDNHSIYTAKSKQNGEIILPQITLVHDLKHPTLRRSANHVVKLKSNSIVTVFPSKQDIILPSS